MKLLVFDLDGTILDTVANLTQAVNYAMDKLDCPRRTLFEVRSFIGNSAYVLMEKALPSDQKELRDSAIALHNEYYAAHLCENTKPYKGVKETLAKLKARGMKLGVFSNKGNDFAKEIVTHFYGDLFDVIRGTVDFSKRKPNPEGLLEIMKTCGATADETLYVGDSDVDIQTATNGGVECLSACWGYQSREKLLSSGATMLAKKPSDILKAVSLFDKAHKKTAYKKPNQKIGLALSGGGTRGVAAIGVIKAFEENGIRFDYVAGTSAGSLVGAAYAAGKTVEEMTEFARGLRTQDFINRTIFKIGNDSGNIERAAQRLLGKVDFSDLKIPFKCVAVDLVSGEEVVLDSGSVCKCVSASCAAPAVFVPVELDGKTLVDGGLLNNIPSDVVRRMGAEFVVSVDLNHTRGKGTVKHDLFSQLTAVWRIVMKSSVFKGQMNTDVMIEPELALYKNTALADADELIALGYHAAMEKMDEIKMFLNIK